MYQRDDTETIPRPLLSDLRELARRHDLPDSEKVREAIRRLLDAVAAEQKPAERKAA